MKKVSFTLCILSALIYALQAKNNVVLPIHDFVIIIKDNGPNTTQVNLCVTSPNSSLQLSSRLYNTNGGYSTDWREYVSRPNLGWMQVETTYTIKLCGSESDSLCVRFKTGYNDAHPAANQPVVEYNTVTKKFKVVSNTNPLVIFNDCCQTARILIVGSAYTYCAGTAIKYTAIGASSAVYCDWKLDGISVGNGANVYSTPTTLSSGSHMLSVAFTDEKGCPRQGAKAIFVNPVPAVTLIMAPTQRQCSNDPVTLTATVSPTGNYTYQWYKGNLVGSSTLLGTTTVNTFTTILTDLQLLFVVVTNTQTGCKGLNLVVPTAPAKDPAKFCPVNAAFNVSTTCSVGTAASKMGITVSLAASTPCTHTSIWRLEKVVGVVVSTVASTVISTDGGGLLHSYTFSNLPNLGEGNYYKVYHRISNDCYWAETTSCSITCNNGASCGVRNQALVANEGNMIAEAEKIKTTEMKDSVPDIKPVENIDNQPTFGKNTPLEVQLMHTPNPTASTTTIKYNIAGVFKKADIRLFDLSGKLLREFPLSQCCGEIKMPVNDLPNSLFLYHLYVDGKILKTNKMVVSNQ